MKFTPHVPELCEGAASSGRVSCRRDGREMCAPSLNACVLPGDREQMHVACSSSKRDEGAHCRSSLPEPVDEVVLALLVGLGYKANSALVNLA